ncbi:F0F1 ATP synthase subunit delta [Acidipropionibacterium jensenii]|uniref:F0F1 ATP synthase subunit delta n=1 Tax=Acidipropionibacterium jensenii TaxID=1749 RepID=UPI002648AB2F|nr:F0F1 ATP synthase subunit delta [Acidipropionibacterium jensenii]MDN5976426.1 F0F1 ATP synthase subunit delta [Acidipropionibacterium jensenii]MDN5995167.1 F0F1 ATP synthase subunit delta [Acidipropionibacterium jensenii]MDN6425797.1 F0F1 ATP synthase subunit delta [Acidipropionibacterium jensenii]MDN6440814.1 F0F1 ATP synthase subunit delta [Acidipropionibacterium jensenii]MDN6479517.1 F0F1 ATP synthase subunit delta [Acidipropionibacterium jensenii]
MTSAPADWGVAAERTATLDAALDGVSVTGHLSEELFAVVDLLNAQPTLCRALSDAGSPAPARQKLASQLLSDQLSAEALTVVEAAAAVRWPSSAGLSGGLERQAVRALLLTAVSAGQADQVEEELFRLRQTVLGDLDLSVALEDRDRPVADRRELVRSLLADRSTSQTGELAARAVPTTGRAHYEQVLARYLELSADLRGASIAVVTTARALSTAQREEMVNQLERITGHHIDLRETVDPSVLGGARINLPDEVIDGTVARRLDQARQSLG